MLSLQVAALAALSDWSGTGRMVGVLVGLTLAIGLGLGARSDAAWVRGSALVLAGSLATGVGAGLAPVWYATTGVSWVVLLGVSSIVVGVGLLAQGSWTLVRAVPGWWRLLALPIAFAWLQLVMLPFTMAIYGTHPPVTPTTIDRPVQSQDVDFETSDGVRIAGWFTAPANGRTVILLPGSGGEKGSLAEHAKVLVSHGYGTLSLDSRGTGASDGVGNAWGWRGTAEIVAAVDWLAREHGVPRERVALLGLSMGGEEALTAAAELPGLGGVVAEGASARTADDLGYLGTRVTDIIERIDAVVMWAIADVFTEAAPPIPLRDAVERAAASGTRLLLVVGEDAAEVGAAERFAAVAPGVEIWYSGAPHMQALARDAAAWEARVMSFLEPLLPAG